MDIGPYGGVPIPLLGVLGTTTPRLMQYATQLWTPLLQYSMLTPGYLSSLTERPTSNSAQTVNAESGAVVPLAG